MKKQYALYSGPSTTNKSYCSYNCALATSWQVGPDEKREVSITAETEMYCIASLLTLKCNIFIKAPSHVCQPAWACNNSVPAIDLNQKKTHKQNMAKAAEENIKREPTVQGLHSDWIPPFYQIPPQKSIKLDNSYTQYEEMRYFEISDENLFPLLR